MDFGIETPDTYYPGELCKYLGRKIWEWRVFVRYGEILDVKLYKGDWRLHFNPKVIESCIKDYVSAPAGYVVDFGGTEKGDTVLIEVNDGYSIGCCGLMHINYSKLLSARWAELTGTEDECRF